MLDPYPTLSSNKPPSSTLLHSLAIPIKTKAKVIFCNFSFGGFAAFSLLFWLFSLFSAVSDFMVAGTTKGVTVWVTVCVCVGVNVTVCESRHSLFDVMIKEHFVWVVWVSLGFSVLFSFLVSVTVSFSISITELKLQLEKCNYQSVCVCVQHTLHTQLGNNNFLAEFHHENGKQQRVFSRIYLKQRQVSYYKKKRQYENFI